MSGALSATKLVRASLSAAELAELQRRAPAHFAPVVDAMRTARLGLLYLAPGQRVRRKVLPKRRPSLAIVGEDTLPGSAVGPDGYTSGTLAAVLRGAAMVVVHAAAPDAKHYAMAAAAALRHGHAAVIETQPARVGAWVQAVDARAPTATTVVISPDVYPAGGRA